MASSIANYFSGLGSLQDQEFAKSTLNQRLIDRAYQPFDKELLHRAISDGGSLAQAPSFTQDNLWTMTPETFQTAMKNQVPITKQISDAVQLNEMVTGNQQRLKNATALEHMRLGGAQQNIGTAVKMQENAQSLEEQQRQFANTQDYRNRQLSEQIKNNRESNSIARGNLQLNRDKAVYEIAYHKAATAQAQQGATGLPADPKMYDLYEKTMRDSSPEFFKVGEDKKPAVDYDKLGKALYSAGQTKVIPPRLLEFTHNDLKRLAVGKSFGTVQPLHGYAKVLGGWTEGYLRPDGWYGLTVDGNGTITGQSPRPIVPFGPAVQTGKGSGGYNEQLVKDNKYPNIPR